MSSFGVARFGRFVEIFEPGAPRSIHARDAIEVAEPGQLAVGTEERHHDLAPARTAPPVTKQYPAASV